MYFLHVYYLYISLILDDKIPFLVLSLSDLSPLEGLLSWILLGLLCISSLLIGCFAIFIIFTGYIRFLHWLYPVLGSVVLDLVSFADVLSESVYFHMWDYRPLVVLASG